MDLVYCLEHERDISLRSNYRKNLHKGSRKDDCHALKRLIQSDDPVDDQNDYDGASTMSAPYDRDVQISVFSLPGNSAINIVAKQKKCCTVVRHLDMGALLFAHGPERCALLHHLAHSHLGADRELTLLQSLVSKGTDINAQDPRGCTALESAAERGKWAMSEFLINNGAVVKPVLHKGDTFFHLLARRCYLSSDNSLTSVVKLLLLHDVDINRRNDNGDTALHIVLQSVHKPLLKIFSQHGADPSLCDGQGTSVFHKICAKQVVSPWLSNASLILEALALFVSKGLNINLPGKDGNSGLSMAVKSANWTIVEHLVALGAQCTMKVEESCKTFENLHLFPQKTSNPQRLHLFITHVLSQMPEERENNIVSNIPEENNSVGEQMPGRKSAASDALSKCISEGNFFMAEALIRCGSDLRLIFADYTLHSLVEHYTNERHDQWIRCLDTLLSLGGVDIKCRYGGSSVLEKAVKIQEVYRKNSLKDPLILALLERGADPLFTDENGHTLLSLIVDRFTDFNEESNLSILTCLLQLGVTTHQPRLITALCSHTCGSLPSVRSPTEMMLRKRNIAVLEILIESGASSNHELWDLHRSLEKPLSLEAEKDAHTGTVLKIVKHAACHPRSLRSLCRLVISHAVGVDLERTKRVASLPVPLFLQQYVLFADLLSPE